MDIDKLMHTAKEWADLDTTITFSICFITYALAVAAAIAAKSFCTTGKDMRDTVRIFATGSFFLLYCGFGTSAFVCTWALWACTKGEGFIFHGLLFLLPFLTAIFGNMPFNDWLDEKLPPPMYGCE